MLQGKGLRGSPFPSKYKLALSIAQPLTLFYCIEHLVLYATAHHCRGAFVNWIYGDTMPNLAQKGVAAVDRALSILVALGNARRALTLSETAVATGLYKSTTLRLLGSLQHAGFVVREQDGRFRLGSTIYKLASTQEPTAIEDAVAPVLQRIVDKTGESVGFFVRQGDQRFLSS